MCPNYSFKPRPLRGSAYAVSCTTTPSRCAVRLNSGVSAQVKIIARRQKIDWWWLGFGLAMSAWWLVCLYQGETYVPVKNGPWHLYVLTEDPQRFWLTIKVQAVFSGWLVVWGFVHSPWYNGWKRRMDRRMRTGRRNPAARSWLWIVDLFLILILALISTSLVLVVFYGAR